MGPVDGGKAWVETIEAPVQKVSHVAVHIHTVVELVAGGADVVYFQNPTRVKFPLDAKEPVMNISGGEIGIKGARISPDSIDAIARIQALSQRCIHRVSLVRLTRIAQAIRERVAEQGAKGDGGEERGVRRPTSILACPVECNAVAPADRHFAAASRIPGESKPWRKVIIVKLVAAIQELCGGVDQPL